MFNRWEAALSGVGHSFYVSCQTICTDMNLPFLLKTSDIGKIGKLILLSYFNFFRFHFFLQTEEKQRKSSTPKYQRKGGADWSDSRTQVENKRQNRERSVFSLLLCSFAADSAGSLVLPISLPLLVVLQCGQALNIVRFLFLSTVITIIYRATQEIVRQVA